MIDKSGTWWKGEDFDDLTERVVTWSSHNHRADDVRRSVCGSCGGTVFALTLDADAGCAERRCRRCGEAAFIADSADWWDDADPGEAACPCGGEDFEIAVGFSMIESGEINWITVGCRCVACGVLGVYVDWKIDYEPSRHLLTQV